MVPKVERAKDEAALSLTLVYEIVKDYKPLASSANAWINTHKMKKVAVPLEPLTKEVSGPKMEVHQGKGYVDADGWRVRYDSGMLELIHGNKRYGPILANVGRYKLDGRHGLHIRGILGILLAKSGLRSGLGTS